MLKNLVVALVLVGAPAIASAQEGKIFTPSMPEGGELERTTSDPGWWQRTFVGWDVNGDGIYSGGERGVLLQAWESITGSFIGIGNYMLDAVWKAIPLNLRPDVSGMLGYIAIANTWLPLDFMLGLFFTYYSIVATLVAFRYGIKFIPFIG